MKNKLRLTLLSSAILTLTACGGGSDSEPEKPDISPPEQNQAPTIELATTMEALERSPVTIAPSISDDGTISSYMWEQTKGDAVELDIVNSDTLSFTAPNLSTSTTLTFSITATDNNGSSSSSSIDVIVNAYPEVDLSLIDDSSLRSCISNNQVDQGSTYLTCIDEQVESIAGLDQLNELAELRLYRAYLTEIPDLSHFGKLSNLALNLNNVEGELNLHHMSQVQELELLGVNCSNTIDFTPITNLGLLALTCAKNDNDEPSYSEIDLTKVNTQKLTALYLDYDKHAKIVGLNEMHALKELSFNDSYGYYYDTEGVLNSLNFLEAMPELNTLALFNQPQVDDLSALRFTPKLSSLSLTETLVTDFSALKFTPGLKSLSLDTRHNRPTLSDNDINAITSLDELEYLKISSYELIDARPIASLSGLHKLELQNTNTTSISFVGSLTSLKELSIISNNYLADITPIEQLNLTSLSLSNINNLRAIDSIATQSELEHLVVEGIDAKNLTVDFLNQMPMLKSLRLINLSLGDLSPVSNLVNLEYLQLQDLYQAQIPSLNALSQLNMLNIGGMEKATSLNGLSKLTSLEQLSLAYTPGINDFTPLRALTGLEYLALTSQPSLTKVSFLETLHNLRQLDLIGNDHLAFIAEPISKLTSLYSLDLGMYSNFSCEDIDKLEAQFVGKRFYRPETCTQTPIDLNLFSDPILKNCVANIGKLELVTTHTVICNYINEINDFKGLEQLTYLNSLQLRGDISENAENLDSLSNLNNLRHVAFEGAQRSLPLKKIFAALPTSVLQISFKYSNKTDTSALTALPDNILVLDLSYTELSSTSSLIGLTHLSVLDLTNNPALTCSELAKLEKALANTQISYSQLCE